MINRYKAIIFDLDGTAIPNIPNGMPSERLRQVITNSKDNILLCAATGRPLTNANPIIKSLGLRDPCVISAGTQIVDPTNNKILWETNIEPSAVKQVFEIASNYNYELLVRNELMGEGTFASHRDFPEENINVMYIMGSSDKDTEYIMNKLKFIPSISASSLRSWSGEGSDIHVTNINATKEHAIAELLKIVNVSKDETVGVGDANNDIHLFKAVGHKVAMGNATDLLKSQADEVCETVDNDGLADVIESVVSVQNI